MREPADTLTLLYGRYCPNSGISVDLFVCLGVIMVMVTFFGGSVKHSIQTFCGKIFNDFSKGKETQLF